MLSPVTIPSPSVGWQPVVFLYPLTFLVLFSRRGVLRELHDSCLSFTPPLSDGTPSGCTPMHYRALSWQLFLQHHKAARTTEKIRKTEDERLLTSFLSLKRKKKCVYLFTTELDSIIVNLDIKSGFTRWCIKTQLTHSIYIFPQTISSYMKLLFCFLNYLKLSPLERCINNSYSHIYIYKRAFFLMKSGFTRLSITKKKTPLTDWLYHHQDFTWIWNIFSQF
jgi:hypothetical protein